MSTTVLRTPAPGVPLLRAVIYTGLALTVVATAVAYADQHALADHVRAGYPGYSPARVDRAVTTYLAYLSIVGALGVAGWLTIDRAVRAGRRWAPAAAVALFLIGTAVALTDLLIRDTSGGTGLAPLVGWLGVAPCVPGLVVAALAASGKERAK